MFLVLVSRPLSQSGPVDRHCVDWTNLGNYPVSPMPESAMLAKVRQLLKAPDLNGIS